ncbi:DUF3953 domain-containing protein [Rossellomorea aquimaris]|uniref:DUF3953 domain-containing protein n=1 Tax=Rossellomorea aquimaris TaxID=189382 RepID=UPI001CD6346E|nr:DUF3953 domain-containing protein [Rossellomorea aquimaris]MCA1055866.1 DUF3953 domain-containing protein [Rossellomorea aquimaris]
MKLLKKVNVILAIMGIVLCFTYFLGERMLIPTNLFIPYLLIMFFLMGIEQVKGRRDRGGYIYLFAAIAMTLAAMIGYLLDSI